MPVNNSPLFFVAFHASCPVARAVAARAAAVARAVAARAAVAARVVAVARAVAGRERPATLAVLDRSPLFLVGSDTFLDEMLETVGARNLGRGLAAGYPRGSIEWLIAAKPELLLDMTPGSQDGRAFWARWQRGSPPFRSSLWSPVRRESASTRSSGCSFGGAGMRWYEISCWGCGFHE